MKKHFFHSVSAALIVSVAALCAPLAAHAKPFSQFIEFSGALSDTGNFASKNGNSPAPFYKNRTTNGPVAGELLAARLGLKAEASYHLTGPAVGTNFAVRDALAGADGPNDLPAQLRAYLEPVKYKADPDAFFFVFNGGNDVIAAVMTPDDKQSEKILDDAVNGLEKALRTLVKSGAKTIMAPNFIDLSIVPAVRKANITDRAKRISVAYNQKFESMLDRVENDTAFKFIRWDFDRFLKNVIARSDEFGFVNNQDPCEPLMTSGKCDPNRFLFLTDVFPTAKVHELMAEAMALTILQRDSKTGK